MRYLLANELSAGRGPGGTRSRYVKRARERKQTRSRWFDCTMARIDSLLNLVDRQGANELRLGADREPQMFAEGTPKRLTMPKTSMETLRELLGI